ncbi:hypothetical protein [Micromonospora sp. NPDC023888]|uniref:hypothetical protein n=1 Tax=Micromonospora sp. NPDC023888 TaxID=3155607 RepID=UPI0033FA9561
MTEVPWWGVPVVAGVFTLIGVVAAQAVAVVLDRARAEREDAVRWHADSRRVYAAFLAQAHKIYVKVIAEWKKDSGWKSYHDDLQGLLFLREEVTLTGSGETWAVAGRIFEELVMVTDSREARSEVDYQSFIDNYNAEIQSFILAARAELGIRNRANISPLPRTPKEDTDLDGSKRRYLRVLPLRKKVRGAGVPPVGHKVASWEPYGAAVHQADQGTPEF